MSAVAATEATGADGADGEIHDAEIVGEDERLLPAVPVDDAAPATPPMPAPVPFHVTRHTVLAEGELPPRADGQPTFTATDFTVPDRVKKRIAERGARNTRVNRDSTRTRFEQWCRDEGRVARPTTTTANVAAYFGHLMETGKPDGGGRYSPDSLLAYCSRIVSWYPKGERPDASLVREMIEDYRLEEFIPAGGETERSAGLTLKYLVQVLAGIDETTRIGRRDAAVLVLQYGMLYRSVEVANLLVKHVRVDADGVWVWTAMSKTRRTGRGRWRFVRDRADLRTVARVRAWLADLRELREPVARDQNPVDGEPAYLPAKPLFRALTTTGNLKRRQNATVRGSSSPDGRSTRWSRRARPPPVSPSSTASRSPPTACARDRTPTWPRPSSRSPSATRPATGRRPPPSPTTSTTAPTAPSTPASTTRSTPFPSGGGPSGRRPSAEIAVARPLAGTVESPTAYRLRSRTGAPRPS